MSTVIADYKYIRIEWEAGDLNRYWVVNKRACDTIAMIDWYASWRQWVAVPTPDTVWNADCLADLIDALAKVAAHAKEQRKGSET